MGFDLLRWASLLFSAVFLLIAQPAISGEKSPKIRFGTLPVLQALPVYVAQDKGFFGSDGLDVELIPFNTAAEKDIALAAGSIDGYFGDLLTPIVLKGNGRDVFIVAANYDTRFDRRMFAVLGKPGGPYKTISDLASVPIGISSNTVIDYVTERLLASGGLPPREICLCGNQEHRNANADAPLRTGGGGNAAGTARYSSSRKKGCCPG